MGDVRRLKAKSSSQGGTGARAGFGSVVLKVAFQLLTPFILLYGVYVLMHGHYGPGGGFQAGALLGFAVVFAQLVQGHDSKWIISRSAAIALACLGALLYLAVGVLSFIWGGNFLDYGVVPWAVSPAEARALGILAIETGVTMSVMAVIVLLFDLLTGGEERD